MSLALLDLIRPYFFTAMDLGAGVQNVLEFLHVDEYDSAWDEDGVVITGVARIDSTNPGSAFFSPQAGGGASSGSPGSNPGLVKWNFHDVAIRFRLTLARRAANALPLPSPGDLRTVLDSLGRNAVADHSDYPNTQFRLELMFELVSVTLPKLIGAKLQGFVMGW